MARIRTIKPEFWTDEIIVRLPFEARLLYIGLWNFADDLGRLWYEPERIAMQVLPRDVVHVDALLDILSMEELIEILIDPVGQKKSCILIRHFNVHQKVDHPAPSKIRTDEYKKRSIPFQARHDLAKKYGCDPGKNVEVACYYCGKHGRIHWWNLSSGEPSSWIVFPGLEIDHFNPEIDGHEARVENLVLACQRCNRSKGAQPVPRFLANIREKSRGLAPEGNGMEGKGMEGNGREWKGKDIGVRSKFAPPTLEDVRNYCRERNNIVNPSRWFDFYSSKGWMVGRNKMRDWKAAVRTWENNGKDNGIKRIVGGAAPVPGKYPDGDEFGA